MIERRRLDDPPKRRQRRTKPRPLYARITRVLLHHPPIKHRNNNDRRLVSPFEFAVAAGVNALASCALVDEFHRRALKGGAKAIEAEQQTGAATKRIQRRDRDLKGTPPPAFMCDLMGITNYRVIKKGKRKGDTEWVTNKRQSFKAAGASGYRRRMQRLKRQPLPKTVTLEITRHHLLRVAGLPTNGTSVSKIGAALKRLRRPVAAMPPLVESCEQLPSGSLRLVVSTDWMEKPFGQIPIPLPTTRSPLAMALYLFLFTISTAAANHETISLRSLCERTGLPISWWSSRALVRALEVVNEHLATLDAEALQDEGIKLPGSFEIVSVDGRVRFRRSQPAVPRRRRRRL